MSDLFKLETDQMEWAKINEINMSECFLSDCETQIDSTIKSEYN